MKSSECLIIILCDCFVHVCVNYKGIAYLDIFQRYEDRQSKKEREREWRVWVNERQRVYKSWECRVNWLDIYIERVNRVFNICLLIDNSPNLVWLCMMYSYRSWDLIIVVWTFIAPCWRLCHTLGWYCS